MKAKDVALVILLIGVVIFFISITVYMLVLLNVVSPEVPRSTLLIPMGALICAWIRFRRELLAGLLVSTVAFVLALQVIIHSEIHRGILVLISMGILIYAWVKLWRVLGPWLVRVLFWLGTLLLAATCGWSGLNVARTFLYDDAVEGRENIYARGYFIVCNTQEVLQWCSLVLAIALVVGLVILPFWMRFRSAQAKQE